MKNKFPKTTTENSTVKLFNGKKIKVVILNNAATTPPFMCTIKKVNAFLKNYSAFHRGSGPNAQKTYESVQDSINIIKSFLQTTKDHSILFSQNTSAAINLFIRTLNLKKGDIIITSDIEHTSNNLPWRFNSNASVVYITSNIDGSLDYEDLKRKLIKYNKRVKLVAITGASNLTGYIPDIKKISTLAHKSGALLFVDAAQLAPHRRIRMKTDGIDALAFSAHKTYAPFGIGVLVIPTKILDRIPLDPGGGSIDMLSEERVIWSPSEIRHQAGTWNTTGIIALAESCKTLKNISWNKIQKHENELIHYALKKLNAIKGIKTYIPEDLYKKENRIGTIVFNLDNYHHTLLSTILDTEYGIETRSGTICNHRIVKRWFNIKYNEQNNIEKEIQKGNRLSSYGIVRISFGIQNSKRDIDALIKALKNISEKGPVLKYKPNQKEETYEL